MRIPKPYENMMNPRHSYEETQLLIYLPSELICYIAIMQIDANPTQLCNMLGLTCTTLYKLLINKEASFNAVDDNKILSNYSTSFWQLRITQDFNTPTDIANLTTQALQKKYTDHYTSIATQLGKRKKTDRIDLNQINKNLQKHADLIAISMHRNSSKTFSNLLPEVKANLNRLLDVFKAILLRENATNNTVKTFLDNMPLKFKHDILFQAEAFNIIMTDSGTFNYSRHYHLKHFFNILYQPGKNNPTGLANKELIALYLSKLDVSLSYAVFIKMIWSYTPQELKSQKEFVIECFNNSDIFKAMIAFEKNAMTEYYNLFDIQALNDGLVDALAKDFFLERTYTRHDKAITTCHIQLRNTTYVTFDDDFLRKYKDLPNSFDIFFRALKKFVLQENGFPNKLERFDGLSANVIDRLRTMLFSQKHDAVISLLNNIEDFYNFIQTNNGHQYTIENNYYLENKYSVKKTDLLYCCSMLDALKTIKLDDEIKLLELSTVFPQLKELAQITTEICEPLHYNQFVSFISNELVPAIEQAVQNHNTEDQNDNPRAFKCPRLSS